MYNVMYGKMLNDGSNGDVDSNNDNNTDDNSDNAVVIHMKGIFILRPVTHFTNMD